jgi:hypothetical protein
MIKKACNDMALADIIRIVLDDGTKLWMKHSVALSFCEELRSVKPKDSIIEEGREVSKELAPEQEVLDITREMGKENYELRYNNYKNKVEISREELKTLQKLYELP